MNRRRSRFDALFSENYVLVRAYVARRIGEAAVDDVLAETFLIAWRRIDSVPADGLPWLLAVARRVLANQRRADVRRGALVERLGSVLPRGLVVDSTVGVVGVVGEAVASLSPRDREALLLVAWEELAPERAARVVGCTSAAFRARLYRARRRLAARLGEPLGKSIEPRSTEEAR